jgi:hypothetical protein
MILCTSLALVLKASANRSMTVTGIPRRTKSRAVFSASSAPAGAGCPSILSASAVLTI